MPRVLPSAFSESRRVLKIANPSIQHLERLLHGVFVVPKLFVRKPAFVARVDEVIEHLNLRRLCNARELCAFRVIVPAERLGNVAGRRFSRVAKLIAESEPRLDRWSLAQC